MAAPDNTKSSRIEIIGDERGGVLILTALMLPILLGFGALAIDISRAYVTKGQLQIAADAAATAGAISLMEKEEPNGTGCNQYPDDENEDHLKAACQQAINYAQANVSERHGKVLLDGDVFVGCYNPEEQKVDTVGKPDCDLDDVNAVQVTTERSNNRADSGENNPLKSILASASVIGKNLVNVRARAIAITEGTDNFIPCMTAKSGEFIVGGSAELNLPNCGLVANQLLNRKGNAAESTVGKVTYRDYDGQKGSSTPEDDFNDGNLTNTRKLKEGETIDTPEPPADAKDVTEVCDTQGSGKIKKDCYLDRYDAYVIDGDLDFTGNTRLYFRQSTQGQTQTPTKIFVKGEFKVRNTKIFGCFQMVAESIDINGNPFASQACDNFEPEDKSSDPSVKLVY